MPVAPEEMVRMRLHQEHDVVAECDLHSQPLLLFRILFFVAMQDSRGEVHLLTAFQVFELIVPQKTTHVLFHRISRNFSAAQQKINSIASS